MIRFIVQRLVGSVVVVFVISLVTFLIFQIGPALSHINPVYLYTGKVPFKPGSPQLLALIHRFGFDLPWYEQYWHFIKAIVMGANYKFGPDAAQCHRPCFGYSFKSHVEVWPQIKDRIPVTFSLAIGAAVI